MITGTLLLKLLAASVVLVLPHHSAERLNLAIGISSFDKHILQARQRLVVFLEFVLEITLGGVIPTTKKYNTRCRGPQEVKRYSLLDIR